ncbi:unnamed protein product [Sphagnum compactum]
MMAGVIRWERVSEAVQTSKRENESQTLDWDITFDPPADPSKFLMGQGLHYPVIYDSAWPLNPSCRRVEKPLCPKKQDVVGSWALTGMTGTEEELVPINKTLCFPHRLTDKPFKSPSKHRGCLTTFTGLIALAKPEIFQLFQGLSLKGLEELEPSAVYRSMLEQLHAYDPKDAKARAMSIRLFLHLPVQLSDFSDPMQSPLSNHLRNRVIVSAKGKHRLLTPRCDATIIQKMSRTNAVVLLQKCIRGRAAQIFMAGTHSRWQNSYEELNALDDEYRTTEANPVTFEEVSEAAAVRTLVQEFMSEFLARLSIAQFDPVVMASHESTLHFNDEKKLPT